MFDAIVIPFVGVDGSTSSSEYMAACKVGAGFCTAYQGLGKVVHIQGSSVSRKICFVSFAAGPKWDVETFKCKLRVTRLFAVCV